MQGQQDREMRSREVMNYCHAVTLALVGWYLLVPLRESDNSAKLRPVPLQEWVYVDSFDTAKECREEGLKEEQSHAKDPLEADQYGDWECIATDDPRLREFPQSFEDQQVTPVGA
jgi:hypothetical protein